jgi:chromate transporter
MKPASGLLALTVHLAIVSSISFGGFPTVLPDVRAFVVSTHGWISDQDFTNIFAMAQAIPGPNMILMMGLIGWKMWGLVGALAASTATFAPPCAIYFSAYHCCIGFRKRAGSACCDPRSFL